MLRRDHPGGLYAADRETCTECVDLACGVDTDVIGDEDNDVCVLLNAHT